MSTTEELIQLIREETNKGGNTAGRVADALESVFGRITKPYEVVEDVPLTGTVDIYFGDTEVYGTNTLFLTELQTGDIIVLDGVKREVSSIIDDNCLYLTKEINLTKSAATAYKFLMPALIEPDKQVLYRGTMWRGLLDGESSLSEGTPWPVCGYKELIIDFTTNSTGVLNACQMIKNDFLHSAYIDMINPESNTAGWKLIGSYFDVPSDLYFLFKHIMISGEPAGEPNAIAIPYIIDSRIVDTLDYVNMNFRSYTGGVAIYNGLIRICLRIGLKQS